MVDRSSIMRSRLLAILLPMILLFSQQGALLHELSHWHFGQKTTEVRAEAPDIDSDVCLDCLGFAQVAGLAHLDLPALAGPDGLRYHFIPEVSRHVADASVPAARSRGPPHTS